MSMYENLKILFQEAFIAIILIVILPTTILAVIVAGQTDLLTIALAMLLMALLDMSANALNNYADWDIDTENKKRTKLHALLSKRQLLLLALLLLALTIPFFVFGNNALRITMLLGYFLIYNYSLGFKFKDHLFQNYVCIAIFYAALAFAVGFFFADGTASMFLNFLWMPIFLSILDIGFSVTKDYEDVEGDRLYGKVTLPLKYGKKFSISYQIIVTTISFLFVAILSLLDVIALKYIAVMPLYFIALYALSMVRNTRNNDTYHAAHNIIRTDALCVRFCLAFLFLFF